MNTNMHTDCLGLKSSGNFMHLHHKIKQVVCGPRQSFVIKDFVGGLFLWEDEERSILESIYGILIDFHENVRQPSAIVFQSTCSLRVEWVLKCGLAGRNSDGKHVHG